MKVKMNEKGRVESLEKDLKPNWIDKNPGTKPAIPRYLLPMVNKYTEGTPVTKDIEVIPPSGQVWSLLRNDQKAELLELVEFVGLDVDEYVRTFESMYPLEPRWKKRD